MLLVDTLARLNRERPGRYELTWAGFGRQTDEVAARVKELGISDLVHLTGFVPRREDVFNLYRQAHAFLHVSITEGLPQVIVEALAFGLPVVASAVGASRAALDVGRAGILVPPRDGDALFSAVLRITDDPELRRRLAAHGLQRAHALGMEAQVERVAAFLASR